MTTSYSVGRAVSLLFLRGAGLQSNPSISESLKLLHRRRGVSDQQNGCVVCAVSGKSPVYPKYRTESRKVNRPSGGNCNLALMDGSSDFEYGNGTTSATCGFATTSANPKPGPLANHDGPTQTMMLNYGSADLDMENDSVCAAAPVNNEDQHGATRPVGPHCDIGAYEGTPLADFLPIIPK